MMKKLITIGFILLSTLVVWAQSPEEISYQAVIRDGSNKLVANKQVGVRISILQGSATGIVIYSETQTPTTNADGLVSIAIGTGTTSEIFSAIDWSAGPYFIRTETDPNGGANYTISGTSQLLSVPYALYAKTAESGVKGSNLDNIKTSPNIKIGTGAGMNTPDFKHDLAIGDSALFYNGQIPPTNTQANMNTAVGYKTLFENTTGYRNTALGFGTLQSNTTGNNNSAIGLKALNLNTTGARNTACGDSALYSNTTGYDNLAIGNKALYSNTSGYDNLAFGNMALSSNTADFDNLAIGNKALYSNYAGYENVGIGNKALYSNFDGYDNVGIGHEIFYSNTTGYDNAGIGSYAFYNNTTGHYNTGIGSAALFLNSSGNYNTATGYFALYNNNGPNNTAAGSGSLQYNTTGNDNTAVGYTALDYNRTGSYNTAIGSSTGPVDTNLTNTGCFGYYALVSASNTIQIGNSSVTQIGGYVAWSNLSDGRFKTNVKANVPGLDFIMKLRPVTFSWDMDKLDAFRGVNDSAYTPEMLKARKEKETKEYTGFIAQEVEKAADSCNYDFSGLIKPANSKTPYNLSYAEFVVPLVKAVQEQEQTINALKQQNKNMQEEINLLKAALNK